MAYRLIMCMIVIVSGFKAKNACVRLGIYEIISNVRTSKYNYLIWVIRLLCV